MNAELYIGRIKRVYLDRYSERPYSSPSESAEGITNDLHIVTDKEECLHICGENDWAFLALDLLRPIREEARKIVETIEAKKREDKSIKAVALGKNDKRIMDIYFGGKDKCDKIRGLPVVNADEPNTIAFLVEKEEEYPFV